MRLFEVNTKLQVLEHNLFNEFFTEIVMSFLGLDDIIKRVQSSGRLSWNGNSDQRSFNLNNVKKTKNQWVCNIQSSWSRWIWVIIQGSWEFRWFSTHQLLWIHPPCWWHSQAAGNTAYPWRHNSPSTVWKESQFINIFYYFPQNSLHNLTTSYKAAGSCRHYHWDHATIWWTTGLAPEMRKWRHWQHETDMTEVDDRLRKDHLDTWYHDAWSWHCIL